MNLPEIPFNIEILDIKENSIMGIKPVTALDIYDTAGNFHPDGLFSTVIFGKVGDKVRSRRVSYIDIRLKIIHPKVYECLTKIKQMYEGIINGTIYAVWNDKLKDFEKSNPLDGQTGFHFFLKYWANIKHIKNDSTKRGDMIDLIEKYKSVAMSQYVIVYPAGLRDVEVDATGRTKKDDVNDLYARLISISNSVQNINSEDFPELLNSQRLALQRTFNEIHAYFTKMVDGKKKFIMGKWASRKVFDSTRNVISASILDSPYTGGKYKPTSNNTVLGLYQALKCIRPVAIHHIRTTYLTKIFSDVNSPSLLVDKKTLKKKYVNLKPYIFDKFNTDEGLEKFITNYSEEAIRHKYLELDGCYLALIYKGNDNTFKVIHDIDEVPEDLKAKGTITPITYSEFLYASCYKVLYKYPTIVTRYPIAGVGSIYPSIMFTRTTTVAESRNELNDNWEIDKNAPRAHQFPRYNEPFINSLIPSVIKIKNLTADYDGDTSSATSLITNEAIQEINEYLGDTRAYIGTDGKFIDSIGIDTVNYILSAMTADISEGHYATS